MKLWAQIDPVVGAPLTPNKQTTTRSFCSFNDFLNRMQSLLQREDIQMVLNSMGEEKKEDAPVKESLIDGVVTP